MYLQQQLQMNQLEKELIFPLTVDVEERMYAGKIPGGFLEEKEGKQKAILACRLIDRPLRPSFKDGFRCETQIIATV